jgi:KaiC/GvpD/RAD55 family RecA-like ATPase
VSVETKPTDPLAFNFGLEFKPAADRNAGERDERHRQATRLLPYHLGFFDDYLRGITVHDLILLGADSGVGKTDAVTEIAERSAAAGRNVYMFALEAEPREIERRVKFRWIARTAIKREHAVTRDLNYPDWYLGRFSSRLGPLEAEADEYMASLTKLHTYYKGKDFTGADIHRLCLAVQDRADLIIIDHLHYVDIDDEQNENREYKKLVKIIRDTVLTTGTPIVLVVHLKKGEGFREPLVPPLERIHGSSEIFKVATGAVMLSRTPFAGREWHLAPTFLSVPKWRLGGACRQVALCNYDMRTRSYLDEYTLGRLENGGRDWTEIHDSNRPPWARRFRPSGLDLTTVAPTTRKR